MVESTIQLFNPSTSLRFGLGVFAGEMSIAGTDSIEGERLAATAARLRFWPEIKFDRLPCVAALRLQTETRGRLVAAMDHAIFATGIARDSIDHAIFFPFHFLKQLGVARVMRVGH